MKQAPQAWYNRIKSYFTKEGLEKCPYKLACSSKHMKELKFCLYVDDLIFTGNDERMFTDFKKSTMHEFDMTDLGRMMYFFGIEVLQEH